MGTFGCAKEAKYARNVGCMICLTHECGGYYILTVPYSVPKRKSFGEGGTNMLSVGDKAMIAIALAYLIVGLAIRVKRWVS